VRRSFVMVLLIAGCGVLEPERLCGCPPELGTVPIAGVVRSPSGAAVSGARVVAEAFDVSEATATETVCATGVTFISTSGTSASDGRFRVDARYMGGRGCFRLWAEPPGGSGFVRSDTQTVAINPDGTSPTGSSLTLHLKSSAATTSAR
jgi:hypothetical protein